MSDQLEQTTKAKLNKALYNAIRSRIAKSHQNNIDEIKDVRDNFMIDLFNKNYKDCDEQELIFALEVLATKDIPSNKITPAQRKLLTYYSIQVASVYCDFSNFMLKVGNKLISGESVREKVQHSIARNDKIDYPIYKFMLESYINPTSHKFLIEGSFKSYTKNKSVLYYELLTTAEANYLIQRYMQFFQQITSKIKSINYNIDYRSN